MTHRYAVVVAVAVAVSAVACSHGPRHSFGPESQPTPDALQPQSTAVISPATASTAETQPPSAPSVVPYQFPRTGDVGEQSAVVKVGAGPSESLSLDAAAVESLDDLTARLQSARETNASTRVIIMAEREVSYARVMSVLDAVKKAGIDSVAFAVPRP